MAAPTIYVCPSDYSQKIPSVFARENLSARVDTDRFPKFTGRKDRFVYQITNGRYIVDVYGGSEKDGTCCFFVSGQWSWNPWSRRDRRNFRDRVVSILLREGAHILSVEELIAQEERKKSA